MTRRVSRRTLLRGVAATGGAAASGCTGILRDVDGTSTPTDGPTATPTDTPTPPAVPDRILASTARSLAENIDESTADRFRATIVADGEYTPAAERLAGYLDRIDADGDLRLRHRDGVAASVAEIGTLREAELDAVHRWLDSPLDFQREAFAHGLGPSKEGYKVHGLVDGYALTYTDLGMRGGFEDYLDVSDDLRETLAATDRPGLAALIDAMANGLDGYTRTELDYLGTAREYAPGIDHPWSRWSQAAEYGLLHDTAADGVTADEYSAFEDADSDGLIDAKEADLGTDPTERVTAGDGIADGLKYLVTEFLDEGLYADVALDYREPNVVVEVDSAVGVPTLTDAEIARLKETFLSAPEDVGPIHLHVVRGDDAVPPVDSSMEFEDEIVPRFRTRSACAHYGMLNDGKVLNDDGERMGGVALAFGNRFVMDGTTGSGSPVNRRRVSLFAHELGHSLGLRPWKYEGIDSYDVPFDEYESVMNYDRSRTFIGYNDGEPYDDWEEIRADDYSAPDCEALEDTWENGVD